MIRALILSLILAAPVRAQTYAEPHGLGDAVPHPEDSVVSGSVDLRARITDRKGRLVTALKRSETIYVEISGAPVPDADFAAPYACEVEFVNDEGYFTMLQPMQDCPFAGQLASGYQAFGKLLGFRPEASDPAGTSGVYVRIRSGAGVHEELFVTFDWQGGRK